MKRFQIPAPLRIALIYLVLGILWIFFSSMALAMLVQDPLLREKVEIVKGWTFMGVTAGLLYFLIQRELGSRQAVQKVLQENQRTLSSLMASLPGMVYRCRNDKSWTMQFASDGAVDLVGYAAEDLIENKKICYGDLIRTEDREFVWSEVQKAIAARAEFRVHYRIRHFDGREKWVWEQGQGVFSENGELLFLEGLIIDVTERQLAQQGLKLSNERLKLIAKVTGTVVGTAPLEEQATEMAKQVREAFGVDGCVIRILDGSDMVLLGSAGIRADQLKVRMSSGWGISKEIMERRQPAAIEDVYSHAATAPFTAPKPNTYSFRSFAGAPLMVDGEVIGILGVYSADEIRLFTEADLEHLQILANHIALAVANDRLYKAVSEQNVRLAEQIKERERAELRIREQAALLDKARDAILVCDLEGRILFWNHGAERLYGWSAKEIAGKSVKEVLVQDAAKFEVAQGSVLKNAEWAGEFSQTTRDGREIIVESRWTLVRDDAGNAKAIFVINTDISERKQVEGQFLRAQRMESIGTLAGGIAHDLNNVLSPILMSIALLRKMHPDDETEEVLATVEGSAKRGAEMVRQVLTYARGVQGERVTLDAGKLLGEVQKIIRETFPKSIRIECQVSDGVADLIGDSTQLHQVLLNLCVNARDAMPAGGKLTLTAENLALDDAQKVSNPQAKAGSYVGIRVADTGTGIPPEVKVNIFEPFFTTKEVGKGTGLGLSTTLAIVKSHGGFMDLQTEVGKGSVFTVYLPALVSQAAVPEVVDADDSRLLRGRGEMILVVEDEAAVRKSTQKALQLFGYQVITAEDGAEAVAIYRQRHSEIHLVLTDMMMPIMDGPATIERLRKLNPDVKIVAASGNFAKVQGASGVKAFLAKPYRTETLLRTVREVVDGQSAQA